MGKREYKKYNKRLLALTLSIIAVLAAFNVLLDPFNAFDVCKIQGLNKIKPEKNRQQRVTKVVELKFDKSKIDSVFIGSSRVDGSIEPSYYKELTGKNSKNLAMNALTHSETVNLVQNVVKIHPEIKTVYIGLDFFRFLKGQSEEGRSVNITSNPRLTINEVNPLVLSFDTIVASFNTLLWNVQKRPEPDRAGGESAFLHRIGQYKGTYENATLDTKEFKKLSDLKKELNAQDINVVFYLNPTHASDLYLIKELGYENVINEWKKELAQNFDYYDFDFANYATSEPINSKTKYFYESSHSTRNMGRLVITSLLKGCDDNVCRKVTKNNVDEVNRDNAKELSNWENNDKYSAEKVREIVKNNAI